MPFDVFGVVLTTSEQVSAELWLSTVCFSVLVRNAPFSLSIDPDDPHADLYDADDETTVITLAVRSLIDPSSEHPLIHRLRTGTTLLALRPLQ